MKSANPSTHDENVAETGVVLIPLNKLKKSPKNARKTAHAKAEIEALAASIHAKGVLQNLVVEPEVDAAGARTGFFLVVIGEGRRLAQCLRAKRKQIRDVEPIRCVVDTTNDALEISLDENVTRSVMSVMDEVEAFAALVDGAMSVEDVARRFGCTVRLVEQRLALARLSPKIRAAHRKGDINLDVARAFAINDDHAAQERVFRQFAKPITHAQSVRNALTVGRVPAHDRLARFVGAEAYEAAGGRVGRDLFEPDIVFFDDGELLQRLAGERLDLMRDELAEEGWSWTGMQLSHGQLEGCASERLYPSPRKLKPAEQKKIAALEKRLSELDDTLEDADHDHPLWGDRDEIDAELDRLREAARIYDKRLMAHAGAVIAIDRDGRPVVTRGLIKRADLKTIAKLKKAQAREPSDEEARADQEETSPEPQGPRLTKVLVERLTQARTRALRAALALNPHVALALLVDVLLRRSLGEVSVPGVAIEARAIDFDDDDSFARTRASLAGQAPERDLALFGALIDRPVDELLEALAILIAETVDLTHGGLMREDSRMQRVADALAAALGLDMAQSWAPTQEFWEAAPKALALEALKTAPTVTALAANERAGVIAAFGKMKKLELASAAAQALKDTGWLPELLLTPSHESAFARAAEGEPAREDRGRENEGGAQGA